MLWGKNRRKWKVGSHRVSNPGHLWLELHAVHCRRHWATTARKLPTLTISYEGWWLSGCSEHYIKWGKTLGMGSFLMQRIFQLNFKPAGYWQHILSGCQVCNWGIQCHLCTTDCESWWLSCCCGSVAEHRVFKPEVSWVRSLMTATLFTFLYFHLITSKFLYSSMWQLKSSAFY